MQQESTPIEPPTVFTAHDVELGLFKTYSACVDKVAPAYDRIKAYVTAHPQLFCDKVMGEYNDLCKDLEPHLGPRNRRKVPAPMLKQVLQLNRIALNKLVVRLNRLQKSLELQSSTRCQWASPAPQPNAVAQPAPPNQSDQELLMKFKTALNLDTIESDVESECKIYFPEEGKTMPDSYKRKLKHVQGKGVP